MLTRSEAGKIGYEKVKAKLLVAQAQRTEQAKEKWAGAKCLFCGESIPYEKRQNKFCNHSHAAAYINSGQVRCKHFACKCCGRDIKPPNEKYCSNKCQKEYEWKIEKEKIAQEGKAIGRRIARRFMIDTCGCKCAICGFSEWLDKPLVMILDHIDGNSENCSIDNYRLLCPNCDSQTSTWKGRNRGNGRAWRRQRYKEGKSY